MKTDGYYGGCKGNWRRWQWNRICERLPVKTKDAIVLYLAGMEDLDRKEATRRGFHPENLIAIDQSLGVVRKLRKEKAIAINGDITDIILNWDGPKIHVVVADLCAGLTEGNGWRVFGVCTLSPSLHDNTVWAVNMLRGRDGKITGQLRDHWGSEIYEGICGKNRVLIALFYVWLEFFTSDSWTEDVFADKYLAIRDAFNLSTFSYRSRGNRNAFMDSGVFVWPRNFMLKRFQLSRDCIDAPLRKKLAAAKALRMMRINHTFDR